MFADLAYTKSLNRSADLYLSVTPAGLARKIKQDVQTLLLVFDVVHFPMGQFYFPGDELDKRAAAAFFNDECVKTLCQHGLISTTHQVHDRNRYAQFYADERERFEWKFASLPDLPVTEAFAFTNGAFDFDNDLAAELAFRDLMLKMALLERPLGDDYRRAQRAVEDTLRENKNQFSLESFLVRALGSIRDPKARSILVSAAHQAYFVQPDHLSTAQPDRELVSFKTFDREAPSAQALFEGDRYSYFLSSPEFVRSFLLQWIPSRELAALFAAKCDALEEVRRDYRWHEFVEHFHARIVPGMAGLLREAALTSAGADSRRGGLGADTRAPGMELLEALTRTVKFGEILALAYRSYFVKNMIQNWRNSEVREFVFHLRHCARRLQVDR
jgi:hypothetical protein